MPIAKIYITITIRTQLIINMISFVSDSNNYCSGSGRGRGSGMPITDLLIKCKDPSQATSTSDDSGNEL